MDEANKQTGIIVLAAGAARRMEEPKQLLEFEGETLLRRAALAAVKSVCQPVVVILGAHFEKTNAEVKDLEVEICFNENWQDGLSSSIKTGIEYLLRIKPDISAVIFTLGDQPFVTTNHINRFAEKFYHSKSAIIAAGYNGIIGVPALFAREIFDDFSELSGDQGAKRILEKRREDVETIELPEAAFDIDTPQDFSHLKALKPRFGLKQT
jgi:molybdenum cofactor cytidylyltransferase